MVIAAAPPPGVVGLVLEVVVPCFPDGVFVGNVRGPLLDEAVGVFTVPVVGLIEIGGFRPEEKPMLALPD